MELQNLRYIGKEETTVQKTQGAGKEKVKKGDVFESDKDTALNLLRLYPALFEEVKEGEKKISKSEAKRKEVQKKKEVVKSSEDEE